MSTEWICESCVHYPPSSGDEKPCTICDPNYLTWVNGPILLDED